MELVNASGADLCLSELKDLKSGQAFQMIHVFVPWLSALKDQVPHLR